MSESGRTILDRYIGHCRSGVVFEDAKQIEVVRRLDALRDALDSHQTPKSSWFRFPRREQRSIQGLYLWGSVGRGKTFLMDLFFESLERKDKVRIHFYRFMQSVHWRWLNTKGRLTRLACRQAIRWRRKGPLF